MRLSATHPMCRTRRESSSRKCSGPRTQPLSGCRCRSRHTTWVPQPRHKPKIRVHSFRCAYVERRQLLRLVRVRAGVRDTHRVTIPQMRRHFVRTRRRTIFLGTCRDLYIRKLKQSREFAKEVLVLNKNIKQFPTLSNHLMCFPSYQLLV